MGHSQALAPPPAASFTPDLGAFPLVQVYDLGLATLTQTGTDAVTMPVALTGAIALPPDSGPLPWVVILHGRHAGCHFVPEGSSQWPCDGEPRFDLGFAYLAEALAEAGYGVLIPNLNGAFSETYGANPETRNALADQRSGQIIDAHLSRLAQAHQGNELGFGPALRGRVDLSRLAMVGHSMGGGAAALNAMQRADSGTADKIAAGLGPIAALVLVSPTRSYPMLQRPDAYQLPDVPTVVIAGGCDRDIFDLSSLYYAEIARSPARTTPVLGLLLPGANHNFFNAAVAEDDYYRNPNNSPLCNPQRSHDRLSRVAQETFLSQYIPAFLAAVWGDKESLSALALDPTRSAPGKVFGVPVLSQLIAPQRYTVFQPGQGKPVNPSPGLVVTGCKAFADCERSPRPYPPFYDWLTVAWQSPTEQLVLPLNGADVAAFTSLDLHLAPDVTWALPTGSPAMAIVLRDRQGNAARVEIPATVPALRPFELDPVHGFTAPLYPSSLRIPLGQFHGVDLRALESVSLVFDQTNQGKLHLAGGEFVSSWEEGTSSPR
jgi:dienelactone hydrolase